VVVGRRHPAPDSREASMYVDGRGPAAEDAAASGDGTGDASGDGAGAGVDEPAGLANQPADPQT